MSATAVSEAAFQDQVIELARLFRWRVAHFRPAQTSHGWRTPVAADGKGFPDLVLARDGRVIFAELKSATGRVSEDQQAWLDVLPDSHLWRPDQLDEIANLLAESETPDHKGRGHHTNRKHTP